MAINTSFPKTIDHPDIPYDKILPTLIISPRVINGSDVEVAMSITAEYWRRLPDGTIDVLPGVKFARSESAVYAAIAAGDEALAAASAAITAAIQQYLSAVGA